ncbi:hypothetical protein [Streptomyces sp. ITFR-6]|uniref:hypothetical protein n=1 Tax=Streptomyces sp. ITFR-6 TaxID=3075197 RepID=UPI002889E2F4|nr:hypothetical protein [Streptomyces sp. ITFR-6]WNI29769.1 hypothetical protein RLT59_13935 [Streptomyces sp. ITFR-6]
MSQPVPPPNQPYDGQPQAPKPADGNPYAGQQPGRPQPGAQFGGGAPFAPVAPARDNLALGLVVAFVAALVAAGIYGAIIGATKHEIGYAAVGVGAIVGFAAGKVGGRNPALPVLGGLFALIGVYAGQLLGEAIIISKLPGSPYSVTEIFTEHFSDLNTVWKEDSDFISILFFVVAAVVAFSTAKKTAD